MFVDIQTACLDEVHFLIREFCIVDKISSLIVKVKERFKHLKLEIMLDTMNKNLNELHDAVKGSILPFIEPSQCQLMKELLDREITLQQQNFH